MFAKCTSVNGTALFYATSALYWNIKRTLGSVHILLWQIKGRCSLAVRCQLGAILRQQQIHNWRLTLHHHWECSFLFVQSIKSSFAEIELVVMRYANPCGNTAYRVLEGATSPVIFANANQIT